MDRVKALATDALLTVAATWRQGVVGADFPFPNRPLAAINAPMGSVRNITLDKNGNVYIADGNNQRAMKVDASGILTIVAGNGLARFSGDGGPATSTPIEAPFGMAVDGAAMFPSRGFLPTSNIQHPLFGNENKKT